MFYHEIEHLVLKKFPHFGDLMQEAMEMVRYYSETTLGTG